MATYSTTTIQIEMIFDVIASLQLHIDYSMYHINHVPWKTLYERGNVNTRKKLLWYLLINQHNESSGGNNYGYVNHMEEYQVLSENKKREVINIIPTLYNIRTDRWSKLGREYTKFILSNKRFNTLNLHALKQDMRKKNRILNYIHKFKYTGSAALEG